MESKTHTPALTPAEMEAVREGAAHPSLPEPALLPVISSDVVPFAKRRCMNCDGRGEMTILRPIPAGVNDAPGKPASFRSKRLCHCALLRFLKWHRVDVEMLGAQQQLFWKPGREILRRGEFADPPAEVPSPLTEAEVEAEAEAQANAEVTP